MNKRSSRLMDQAAEVRASNLLDEDWYRGEYQDVEILGIDPALHYLKYGARLGRDPNPDFSTRFYYDIHPDAERKGHNPVLHHLQSAQNTDMSADPKRRNVIWAAAKLAMNNTAQALRLAEAAQPAALAFALEILRANALQADEIAWAKHLSRYLGHFGAAAIQPRRHGPDRFHRLACDPLRPVETGPRVSVLMPAWNAERTLAHAAHSILDQTWRPLELIIVDDASTDGTWGLMQALAAADDRVRILRNSRNVGPYVSKNLALTQANGDYVTGHDADDWAHPQRLEHHIRFHCMAGRRVRASTACMLRMAPDGQFGKFAKTMDLSPDGASRIAMISCLFEMDVLRDGVGYWDNVRFGADSELISRTALVLGEEFAHAPLIGMICLDADLSLTNHPEHGLLTNEGKFSPIRKTYKMSWQAWQKSLNKMSAYRPFQTSLRPFDAPPEMLNDPEDIDAVVQDHAVDGMLMNFQRSFECDLCIVTDLRFPGGNASSTLDEVRFFIERGQKVILVHAPAERSRGKPISERYDPWRHIIKDEQRFKHIRCTSLIVRNPVIACSQAFEEIRTKISAQHAYMVVNNSAWRPSGEPVYDISKLLDVTHSIDAGRVQICPISPVMRSELLASPLEARLLPHLAPRDWTPTFDLEQYQMPPKPRFRHPLRLGRHGRDGPEKWLEDPEQLKRAYPLSPNFRIIILGGAEKAKTILGAIPENWEVMPFGAVSPKEYLGSLDAFVYFPNSNLAEGFGRTVAEAMIAGVPCILPHAFRPTFNDLAFYCNPEEVQEIVEQINQDDDQRVKRLEAIQIKAIELYSSKALAKRLPELSYKESINNMYEHFLVKVQ